MSSSTTTTTTTLQTPDGASLHIKSWLPPSSTPPTARICFLHGFSDHSNRYASYFPLLSSSGIAVHAMDQRGWGLSCAHSPAERGKTGPTAQVMQDITSFLKSYLDGSKEGGEVPVYLMGHSMGGQETLYYAATGPVEVRRQVAGYIAVGAWVQLHPRTQPGWLKMRAGKMAARVLPNWQLRNELDARFLSHDQDENQSWKADELCHDLGTLQGLDGALGRADDLYKGVVRVGDQVEDGGRRTRLLLVHGGDDMVTSAVAAREWWEKCEVRDKRCEIYEGVYHNGELCWEEMWWNPADEYTVHVDAPERLRDDVLEFIRKAGTSTADVGIIKSKL